MREDTWNSTRNKFSFYWGDLYNTAYSPNFYQNIFLQNDLSKDTLNLEVQWDCLPFSIFYQNRFVSGPLQHRSCDQKSSEFDPSFGHQC